MISELAKHITPSVTCELEGTVADLHAAGIDVVELNAGEPDFTAPKFIVDSCKTAMDEGKMKYVNVSGIAALRKAITEKLARDNHLYYNPSQICVSTGAKQALFNAVLALMNPGDEAIIPIPGWVSYSEMTKMAGAVPIYVQTKEDYHLDISAIRAAVTEKTKLVFLNSPNNPTGAVYGQEELKELGELACEKEFYILSDEVYEKYVYGGNRHVSIAELSEDIFHRTVVVNGFSKAYAMTGWRIGYSAAAEEIAAAIAAIQGHVTSNSTTMVQWAAIKALSEGDESIRSMLELYEKRRVYMKQRLDGIEGMRSSNPEGAFYYMADFTPWLDKKFPNGESVESSGRLCAYFLEEAHVSMVPGEAFLAPGKIRIAYTNSVEKIGEGMDRIEKALARLQ